MRLRSVSSLSVSHFTPLGLKKNQYKLKNIGYTKALIKKTYSSFWSEGKNGGRDTNEMVQ